MRDRCSRPAHKAYKNYGGRGITVCSAWADDFAQFFLDMGPRPPNTSLERRDNSRGYTKDNCYWASIEEQNSNTRRNRLITIGGVTKHLAAWAKDFSITPEGLAYRLDQGLDPSYKSK